MRLDSFFTSSARAVAAGLVLLAVALPARADELDAIRQRVGSYQAAFNRHDAKAVAEHWSEEAVYVRESGERVQGRAAIQKVFEQLFARDKDATLQVKIGALRLVTPDVAIEDGSAEIVGAAGPAIESSYTAVNVKKNGVWYVDSIRETDLPAVPSHYEKLKELSWMIGEWVNGDDHSTVHAKCEWSKNKNFITRSFSMRVKGREEMSGTQIIGWDGSTGKIRSWIFDSDGGIAEGVWSRSGNRWACKTQAVLPDGRRGSALHILTVVDDKSFTWQSVDREAAGEILPNIDPYKVIRVTGE